MVSGQAHQGQLDWLRSHAVYVSPKLTEVPKALSILRSPVEDAVVRIIELETEITTSMACETLLEMRYLMFLGWDQIAAQLNYTQDYIYHLHRKALVLVKVPCM